MKNTSEQIRIQHIYNTLFNYVPILKYTDYKGKEGRKKQKQNNLTCKSFLSFFLSFFLLSLVMFSNQMYIISNQSLQSAVFPLSVSLARGIGVRDFTTIFLTKQF